MIYLVRHGESVANIQKRFSGITEAALTQSGKIQAIYAGNILKQYKIEHVFSSPLIRSVDTAKIICGLNNINPEDIIIKNCLLEINFGIFENLTWDEITEMHKTESDEWIQRGHDYRFPHGESYDDMIVRISDFIDNISDNSLIVTHFGVIQAILLYLKIARTDNLWNYKIRNCDIIILDKNNLKIKDIIKNASS